MDFSPVIQTIPSQEQDSQSQLEKFDAEEYVKKRMLEIMPLEDRVLYKDIVGDILCKIYRYTQSSFEELENKVLKECRAKQNDYAIYVSLTDKEHYDATDTFLHPMREEDIEETKLSYEDIMGAFKENGKAKLYTIFAETDYSNIYEMIKPTTVLTGKIRTKRSASYSATFQFSQNKEYMEMVEQLYYIFTANYQSWITVCTAYLSKMLDVTLCSITGWTGEEEIEEIEVDFGEYKNRIKYNQIPVWNLKHILQKTENYPDSSIVKVNYVHMIYAHTLSDDCEYLVMNIDTEISNIHRLNGDLYITCPHSLPFPWDLYQVDKKNERVNYPYPVLTNQFKESFAGSITEMYKKSVKTKAEIARLIESFPYGDRIVLNDTKLLPSPPEGWKKTNYSMDSFIVDEIRTGNTKETLLLEFTEVGETHFLNLDIMSFLVAQIQRIFPEYICMGELKEDEKKEK